MKAELIDSMGDDISVVNAARVSFDKASEWDHYDEKGNFKENGVLAERDKKLIRYLTKHNHWTPFSHCTITLRETVPIFVARQRFKHVVGFTYNETSRRYVDDTPDFYVPDVWRKRAENVKQGSSDEGIERLNISGYNTGFVKLHYSDFIDQALLLYTDMIESGIAPEQARMVLPQSMMTSYYVTGSLYAFARAYLLRIDAHAQKEIRDLSGEWDKIIRPLYPESWSALVDGDKNA